MNKRIWRRALTLSAVALLFLQAFAFAQAPENYPTRPVRIVVPFVPGGSVDFVARIIQSPLTAELGKQFVIDNRSGAGGFIGVELVAGANADGHTLLLGNVGTMALNPWLYPSIQPVRDLIPITLLVDVPSMLVAHRSFPPNNLKEFIEYVRANPGKINHSSGSSGLGIASRLEMESFLRGVGLKMTYVGYKGGAAAAAIGLMSNEVQVMFVALPSVIGFVKQNRLKAFAVTAAKRLPALPDVPTMPELGYPGMRMGSWHGVFAPKGTPPAVVQRLFTTLVKITDLPDVKKRVADGSSDIIVSKSLTEFLEFLKAETARFGLAIKQAKDANVAG